ncbi:MAG: cysteine hydrolase family protein [Spirochaetia bacterium]
MEPFDVRLNSAAFVVVDMQNDFVRVGAPLEVPDARVTIGPIKAVLGKFRQSGRPVVFTRFLATPKETLVWKWSPQLAPPTNCCHKGFRRMYSDIKAERECVAVIDELAPLSTEYIVDKYGYGAFFRTNLEDILRAERADTVIVCGTVTQICVEETARESFHHGFKTVMLSDGVSSFDAVLQHATLKNFGMKFGAVMDSAKFLSIIG